MGGVGGGVGVGIGARHQNPIAALKSSPEIDLTTLVYSQSGLYSYGDVWPATNRRMTSGLWQYTHATGTAGDGNDWVKLDMGAEFAVGKVIVGTATRAMGSWEKSHTENLSIEYSTNNVDWAVAGNTGTLANNGMHEFALTFTARYVRLRRVGAGYVAVSQFFVLAPGQTHYLPAMVADYIDPSIGVYSQSSQYPGTTAISNALMTDGLYTNTGAGTGVGGSEWFKLDLGSVRNIAKLIIGTPTNNIPGGWIRIYIENAKIQVSNDDVTYESLNKIGFYDLADATGSNFGPFGADGIYEFPMCVQARYVRLHNHQGSYIACSEFYVEGPGV